MAILRKDNKSQYTVIDASITRDNRLSLKGLGLLVKMLSLPDNWEFSENGLINILNDGQNSIRTGIKELEKLGYLVRKQIRNSNGTIKEVEWSLFEVYQAESPYLGNPSMDNPNWDNQPQYNTNKPNTKKQITNNKGCIVNTVNDMSVFKVEDVHDISLEEQAKLNNIKHHNQKQKINDKGYIFANTLDIVPFFFESSDNVTGYDISTKQLVYDIFKYYFDCYELHTKHKHPFIGKDKMYGLLNALEYLGCDVHSRHICISRFECYFDIIDKYFDTKFQNCDRNILHFFSGDIRMLKACECGCARIA